MFEIGLYITFIGFYFFVFSLKSSFTNLQKIISIVTLCWNPLILVEIGGMGHQEGLMGLLCILALFTCYKKKIFFSAIFLALASLVKIEAILFLPIILKYFLKIKKHEKKKKYYNCFYIYILIIFIIMLFAYIPYGGIHEIERVLKIEALKNLRSIPQAISYIVGFDSKFILVLLRIIFIISYLLILIKPLESFHLFFDSYLIFTLYLFLAKNFLQPWHICILIFLLSTINIVNTRNRILEKFTDILTFFSFLGGYTYLFLIHSLSPFHQTISTIIMLFPSLLWIILDKLLKNRKNKKGFFISVSVLVIFAVSMPELVRT